MQDAQQFVAGSVSRPQIHSEPVNQADDSDLIVYCDGACKNNGRQTPVAGVGVWWGPDDDRNIAERCPGAQTNNRAELIAIARVLETTPISKRKLVIKTDSQYSINCFTSWIENWKRKGFRTAKGDQVKNPSLIRYIDALLTYRRAKGQLVSLEYVPGHKGILGNEAADALANRGGLLPLVPERDWERLQAGLEKELGATPIEPSQPAPLQTTISDQDWEAYAACYADPDELENDLKE